MRIKLKNRLLAGIMCLIMLLSNIQTGFAQETDSSAETFFYLTAATVSKTIIEPVKVVCTENQTIKEALSESGYEFEGIDTDYIYAIEGESGSFNIFMSDGSYDLSQSAGSTKVVAFMEGELYSQPLVDLIIRLGEYKEMTNNVQNYAKAAEAYENAIHILGIADAETAATHLNNLNAAIEEYESLFSGEKAAVTINAVQGDLVLSTPEVEFTDTYGNVTCAEGTEIILLPGKYTFVVSDGGYNRTEGTVNVEGTMTLDVTLPSGQWFGDIRLLRADKDDEGNKIPFDYTQDKVTHAAEYFIDDTASVTGSIYTNVVPGDDLPENDTSKTKLYAVYTGVNGKDYSTTGRSWNSTSNVLVNAVNQGMTGMVFNLEAHYTDAYGYVMIQSYDITLTRVPTCSNIVVKDGNGTSLLADFNPIVTEYTLNTIGDILTVEGEPFAADGCSVTVSGNEMISDTQMRLKDGENEVKVTVTHTNGQSRTYVFTVSKIPSAAVTIQSSDDVSTEIKNVNGNIIEPKEDNVYELIPGETYIYVGTKQNYYHTTAPFTAEDGMTVNVADPVVETALCDFVLYDNSNVNSRLSLPVDKVFASTVYEYTYILSDANTAVYAQATTENSYTAAAKYIQHSTSETYHGIFREQSITKVVDSTASGQILTRSLMKSGYGNTINLYLSKDAGGVTYFQEYAMKIKRSLRLADMSAYADSGDITFVDEENQMLTFDRDILEYYAMVSSITGGININAEFMNEADDNELSGGYYALINGVRYNSLSNVELALDVSENEEDIEIKICHESADALSNTYVIHIIKQEPVAVTFEVKPENAIIFVVNQIDGKPLYAEADGTFYMMPGVPYTYTVTANGYLSQKVTDYMLEEKASEIVVIEMNEAQVNSEIKALEALWPTFRDENNNGVVSVETPINDEDAVLYWANEIGEGYSSGATGCPIIVDGYLYVYAGTKIVKVDTVTGEVVAEGDMVGSSSFAINNPTYGGGMIFVGLSNGRIQAFNADTLESLWVYTDDLKGQPNCHIAYENGYIYTGFWNGETADANYVCISVTDEDPTQQTESKIASWVYKHKGGFYWAGAYTTEKFILVGTDDGESGSSKGYAHVLTIDPGSGKIIDDLQLPHTGDLRCNITYDEGATGKYYFTTKGGYFYGLAVNEDGTFTEDSLKFVKLENGTTVSSMSTSTPTIYNGRAYVGVSGSGQFSAYSGHNISVIDLSRMNVAYRVPTQGYPQTSGILTNAYESETGKVYVYFIDNYTPGKLRVFSDQPGQTKLLDVTQETLGDVVYDAGYVLFTPTGSQAQYAICSPIVDEYGTIYFKNDSAQLMALGSTIKSVEMTKLPDKLQYTIGETFDPTGMQVTATYANGKTRDITNYITYSTETLTADDTEFQIRFEHVMYQNKDGEVGVDYTAPIAVIQLTVRASMENIWSLGDVNNDNKINMNDMSLMLSAYGLEDTECDVTEDGVVNMNDLSTLLTNYGMSI